jgi:hypothetical protein
MTSIVSALTGSGAKKAASAQAGAAEDAIGIQKKTLAEQLKLARESLNLQKEMFNTALELGEPYRAAGTNALAQYESLLYGIPINKTASYMSSETNRQQGYNKAVTASKDPMSLLPDGARVYTPNYKAHPNLRQGNFYIDDSYVYELADGKLKRSTRGTGWQNRLTAMDPGPAPEIETDPFAGVDTSKAVDFTATPGYAFRRDEGQKALERSAAARSGVLSGAQLKGTERYAQDYATGEFDNVLRRLQGLIDTGANVSGAGANQALTSAGMQSGVLSEQAGYHGQYGENVSGLTTQIGAAKASGYLGQQEAGTNLLNAGFSFAGGFL